MATRTLMNGHKPRLKRIKSIPTWVFYHRCKDQAEEWRILETLEIKPRINYASSLHELFQRYPETRRWCDGGLPNADLINAMIGRKVFHRDMPGTSLNINLALELAIAVGKISEDRHG